MRLAPSPLRGEGWGEGLGLATKVLFLKRLRSSGAGFMALPQASPPARTPHPNPLPGGEREYPCRSVGSTVATLFASSPLWGEGWGEGPGLAIEVLFPKCLRSSGAGFMALPQASPPARTPHPNPLPKGEREYPCLSVGSIVAALFAPSPLRGEGRGEGPGLATEVLFPKHLRSSAAGFMALPQASPPARPPHPNPLPGGEREYLCRSVGSTVTALFAPSPLRGEGWGEGPGLATKVLFLKHLRPSGAGFMALPQASRQARTPHPNPLPGGEREQSGRLLSLLTPLHSLLAHLLSLLTPLHSLLAFPAPCSAPR